MDPNAVLMMVLLVFVGGMLYLSSRTRRRQMLAQQQKLDAVQPGVRVTTIAGLQGTVTAVADDTMELEIAPGVRTTWLRAAVRDVVVPGGVIEPTDETVLDETYPPTEDTYRSTDDNTKKDLG